MAAIFEFEDYEKIVDPLVYFNSSSTLNFVVELGTKDKNKNRRFFYSEKVYESKKYENKSRLVEIKRVFRYYLSIDIFGDPISTVITRETMDGILYYMEKVDQWFNPENKVFMYDPDTRAIVITGDYIESTIASFGTGIIFSPIVINNKAGEDNMGVCMKCGSGTNVDMTVGKFKEFINVMRRLEMYTAACTVIASLNMSREEAERFRSLDYSAKNSNGFNSLNKEGFSKNKANGKGNFFDNI